MKKLNSIRLSALGKQRLDTLLDSPFVHDYHKTLLKGIKSRMLVNNLSKSDCDIFKEIDKNYEVME
jgi:hypothetical protein